jgi:hypothetical protein
MRHLTERFNETLRGQTSRRNFLRSAAKGVLGVAAAVVGARAALDVAFAGGPPNYCCTVVGSGACSGTSCPAGCQGTYSWYCCDGSSSCYKFRCQDCHDINTGGACCTAIFLTSMGGCPC